MNFERGIETTQIKAAKAVIPYLEPDNAIKMWMLVKLLEMKSIIEYYKNKESRDDVDLGELSKIFKSEILPSIGGDESTIVNDFLGKINGLPQADIMPLFMELIGKLNSAGMFTEKNKALVMDALKTRLSDEERAKFEMMASMIMGAKQ